MLAGDASPEEQTRQAASDFMAQVEAEPEWQRLFFEFAVYASRNEGFRRERVARYRALRERIAELLERRARSSARPSRCPPTSWRR